MIARRQRSGNARPSTPLPASRLTSPDEPSLRAAPATPLAIPFSRESGPRVPQFSPSGSTPPRAQRIRENPSPPEQAPPPTAHTG